jgi:hypothetical protein
LTSWAHWCHKLGTSLKAVIYRASTTDVSTVPDYYSARMRFCKYPKPPIFDPKFRENVYKEENLSQTDTKNCHKRRFFKMKSKRCQKSLKKGLTKLPPRGIISAQRSRTFRVLTSPPSECAG